MRSLRYKILTGFSVIVLLVTAVAVWTVLNIFGLAERSEVLMEREIAAMDAVTHMRSTATLYNATLLRDLAEHSPKTTQQLVGLQEEFYGWLGVCRASFRSASRSGGLDSLASTFQRLVFLVTLLGDADVGNTNNTTTASDAMRNYIENYQPTYLRLTEQLSLLNNESRQIVKQELTETEVTARWIAYTTLALAGTVLLLSVVASMKVLQVVLRPIRQLTESAQRVAAGEFESTLKVRDPDDEVSALVWHFNTMVERLREHDARKIEDVVVEKRRSEAIVRDLAEVLVAINQDGIVIQFNKQAQEVTGFSAIMAIGRPLAELAADSGLLARLYDDIVNQRSPQGEQMLVDEQRGTRVHYSYIMQPLTGSDGRSLGFVFQLRDVTHFRQLDEMKTKMVSIVSHELRTPLTSMGMSLELLVEEASRKGHEDELQRELLDNMQEDVRRLETFANDLLDLSRIESGIYQLRPASHSPSEVVTAAVRTVLPIAARQEIQIDVSGVGPALPHLWGDRDRVLQVFVNLFTNAIRYTPLNGMIKVAASVDMDTEMIKFVIRDQGPGVPVAERHRIFERFYQVRDDHRAGGSGLGLSIVKEIVEAHGGSVSIESALGEGSTFGFTLPVVPVVQPMPHIDTEL